MSTWFFFISFPALKMILGFFSYTSEKHKILNKFTHSILLHVPKSACFFFSTHCSWSCYIKAFAAYILFWVLDSSDKMWFIYTHTHRNQCILYRVRIFSCICVTHLRSHTVSFLLDGLLSSDTFTWMPIVVLYFSNFFKHFPLVMIVVG